MPTYLCSRCGKLSLTRMHDSCRRQRDNERYAARGSRQQRGITADHDRFAKLIKQYRWSCHCQGECGRSHINENNVGSPLCGNPYGDPDNPIQAGHIVPRSGGGQSSFNNLRPECRACNLRKGSR